MKISYNWMKDFVALNKTTADDSFPPPDDFIKTISAAGYDVEGVTALDARDGVSREDTAIDLRIPRRRCDLTAMHWTAKDLCGVYRRYFRNFATYAMHGPSRAYFTDLLPTWLELNSTTRDCKLLYGQLVEKIENLDSPEWLKNFVIANGFSSRGTLFDVPLFDSRNLGQPCYTLDADKMESLRIVASNASEDGSICSQGRIYPYAKGDAILSIDGKTISILGVVFDDSVTVTSKTTRAVFFSAIFNRDKVAEALERLNPPELNLNNRVASIGLAPNDCIRTVTHALCICRDVANASGFEEGVLYSKYDTTRHFTITSAREINALLSSHFSNEDIQTALSNAELTTTLKDDGKLSVAFPSYRQDHSPWDLAQTVLSYCGCECII